MSKKERDTMENIRIQRGGEGRKKLLSVEEKSEKNLFVAPNLQRGVEGRELRTQKGVEERERERESVCVCVCVCVCMCLRK